MRGRTARVLTQRGSPASATASDTFQGPRWPISKINALIGAEQRSERCWRVGKYLGSMLTFDMGARLTAQGRRGAYEIGSSTMGVRQCYWSIEGPGVRLDSDAADAGTAATLTAAFQTATLVGCERRRQVLSFGFSNGLSLGLDLTNRYGAEADEFVASLRLRGGAYFEMLANGQWEFVDSRTGALGAVEAA